MKPSLLYDIYDLFSPNKQLLDKNKQLQNKYNNSRCFLLLTADSINNIDFKLISNEYTFGSNFIFLHPDIDKLNLDFYLSIEAGKHMDKFGHPNTSNWPEKSIKSNGINQGYLFLQEAFKRFYSKKTKIFLNDNKISYYKKTNLFELENDQIHYLKIIPDFMGGVNKRIDLTKRFSVPTDAGSLSIAIFLLIHLGFKEIYLCGAGYTYKPAYCLHFYDNFIFSNSLDKEKVINATKEKIYLRNKEVNGSLEYYGLLEKDDLYRAICVKKVNDDWAPWKSDRLINNYANSQNVKIKNIVPDNFESPVYEKISWEDVVSNILI